MNRLWNWLGEFPLGPVVRTPRSHFRGLQVWSLVRELRSLKPCDVAQNKSKQKTMPGFNLWLGSWDPTSCMVQPKGGGEQANIACSYVIIKLEFDVLLLLSVWKYLWFRINIRNIVNSVGRIRITQTVSTSFSETSFLRNTKRKRNFFFRNTCDRLTNLPIMSPCNPSDHLRTLYCLCHNIPIGSLIRSHTEVDLSRFLDGSRVYLIFSCKVNILVTGPYT